MKDAPFKITLVLLATYFAVMIAGGLFGAIFKTMGLTGFLGIFLAAFLTVPVGSAVRQAVARTTADNAGVHCQSPMAFSLPTRLTIGAIVAGAITYLLGLSTFYSLGFLMGSAAALLTALTLSIVFYFVVATRS